MLENFRRWVATHPRWTLVIVTVGALMPFMARPFNIDDPLFIWVARQIQSHPGNPYGFAVNWYGQMQPMWNITENPPLASYYLAVAAGLLGWSEIGLHTAYLIPALAVILGTRRLAEKFCRHPVSAALATLFTPVFLVSATSVMCDVPMLAFWVWAVVFWIEGTETNNLRKLFCASLFIALATLTKYFGLCLVPLLAAYSLFEKRKFTRELLFLLIPLAALGAYQLATRALYGHALLSEAATYAKYAQEKLGVPMTHSSIIGLVFAGGCLAVAVFFVPLIWRARTIGILAAAAVLLAVCTQEAILKSYPRLDGVPLTGLKWQIVFWTFSGVSLFALTLLDFWRRRDACSALLFLWVLGTFLFAALLNWTVNARTLLPMAPAVGILLVRGVEANRPDKFFTAVPVCLALGGVLAMLVARADFLLAVAARESAQLVAAKYGGTNSTLWFQGHWGFQFYLDGLGASELDLKDSVLKPGDRLAQPLNNTSLFPLDTESTTVLEPIEVAGPAGLTTWNGKAGAGFYASSLGPLPFVFGHVPPESVLVYELKPLPAPASSKN